MRLTRALALVACLAVCAPGCKFAVKHPAITAGLFGGAIAAATCEIGTDFEADTQKTCAVITGIAGLGLGGIVALAVLLGGEGNTVLQEPMTEDPPPIIREKKKQPPPDPPPEPAPTGPPSTVPPTDSPAPPPPPTP